MKRQQELKIQREKELLEQKKKERELRFTTDYNQIEKTLYKYKQDIQDIKNNVKLKLNEDPDLKTSEPIQTKNQSQVWSII